MSAMRQEGTSARRYRRVIGLDMHPDVFSAAALSGPDAQRATEHWICDRVPTASLEKWLLKQVHAEDLIVIEASGNTFATVERIHATGRQAVVLESLRAGQIRKAYCNTDKLSAVKLFGMV